MSGSPPPEPPHEPPQLAGRRRKRSHTPPTTTSATFVTSPATPIEQTAPRLLGAQTRGGEIITELPVQPGPYVPNYPIPASYQSGSSLATTTTATSGIESRYALSPVSPRTARKPKAHVASACVNCKKKHLRCDNSRPCRRCVQGGKESTCQDVEHKKRGRPPLKPEDPSARRPFESALTPMGSSLGDPTSRIPAPDPSTFGQPPGNLQRYRQLQVDPSRSAPMRGPGFPPMPMYAPASISPSPATAAGTFTSPTRQYPPLGMSIPGQAPPSYSPRHSDPPMRGVGGYVYPYPHQGQMGPPPQMTYSNPIFPRPTGMGSYSNETLPPFGGQASLQLPPIRPAPTGPIDPAITQQTQQQMQQTPQQAEDSRDDGTQERDPKRPKMDIQGILGPKHE
ncbi:hypothetical protein LTR99_004554 [Exophiala xenobiotica]|uniref:Zn(2)-C6 fungal-type domain-containing protein n=1 Tax=Vermiconidia calcicola TaxID=1690605 RepID=A0AAV9QB46_9PEZI|nr:hypothetical protein LTR41_003538 [Exophiala xenobiotica]KAK5539834.1 hypothetical protein LTR25_003539 [Vermiconidia calcicola]KAK5547046.1 hypothetical protein LTR23_003049 [Chaetothyriales sp. CCFEE 6169]KAK5274736.1 hypothetical protein LTR96_001337 [Exophiala xenobiotica]KAK5304098.1 hypothetical protein LTR99_004554 [Exophiala xenobiotica]